MGWDQEDVFLFEMRDRQVLVNAESFQKLILSIGYAIFLNEEIEGSFEVSREKGEGVARLSLIAGSCLKSCRSSSGCCSTCSSRRPGCSPMWQGGET